jgi:hypothetical protein
LLSSYVLGPSPCSDYEAASLKLAKAKADLRAIEANRQITLQQAKMNADAARIEAEGRKNALIIDAEALAQARIIEAESRNEAAEMMTEPFAKQFAMVTQEVEFARSLKATTLGLSSLLSSFSASLLMDVHLISLPFVCSQPFCPNPPSVRKSSPSCRILRI